MWQNDETSQSDKLRAELFVDDVGVGNPEEFVDEGGGFEQDSGVVLLEDVEGSVNSVSVLSLSACGCRNDVCVMFPC